MRVTNFELQVYAMDTIKSDTRITPSGNGAIAQGVEHAGSGAHQAIEKVADAARPAVDRIASGAHQMVDKAKSVATHAADSLEAQADHLKEARTHLTQACGKYLQSSPVTFLSIAVGVGYLISRLTSSK